MKVIGIEVEKIEVSSFLASENKIELSVTFNDGDSKVLLYSVKVSEPEESTEKLIGHMKEIVYKAHESKIASNVSDTNLNLVFKKEDFIKRDLPPLLTRASSYLNEISQKKDASGYLDLVREIKKLKLEL